MEEESNYELEIETVVATLFPDTINQKDFEMQVPNTKVTYHFFIGHRMPRLAVLPNSRDVMMRLILRSATLDSIEDLDLQGM